MIEGESESAGNNGFGKRFREVSCHHVLQPLYSHCSSDLNWEFTLLMIATAHWELARTGAASLFEDGEVVTKVTESH